MTSIMTNNAALAALGILRNIGSQLSIEQNRVSTGMRVASAADNAAYWSVATTMRSDNLALSAVQDALGLGAAKVDTAYAGMQAVVDIIGEMKSRIVAANEQGVDREKVQAEISQLQGQLTSVTESASFSGQNWLSTDGLGEASVVASATRSGSGTFSVRKISIDMADIALFTASGTGLLETNPLDNGGTRTFGGLETLSLPVDRLAFGGSFTMYDGDEFQYDVQDGASLYTVTVNKAVFDQHAGANGVLEDDGEFWQLVSGSCYDAGVGVFGVGDATGFQAFGADFPNPVRFSNFRITGTPVSNEHTIMNVDVTAQDDLSTVLSRVEGWMERATTAAADLGALSDRIAMQETFLGTLSDSIVSGIGRLVDADMNEASTRLRALESQQQLAVQALSIANASPDALLQLFR
jgi:flagellin